MKICFKSTGKALCAIALMLPLFAANAIAGNIAVVDAGSTGSRVYLFSYDENATSDQLQQVMDAKVEPGVQNITAETAAEYFNNLLQPAAAALTDAQRAATPVYLFATSGMRLLPAAERRAVLEQAREHFQIAAANLGFAPISSLRKQVRIINGTEEAVFGWLAANYLEGNLAADDISLENTKAIADIGGGSAEIAFLPTADPVKGYLSFNHQGDAAKIYGTAYDGTGLDAGFAAFAAKVGGRKLAACFNQGYETTINGETVAGTGDFAACSAAVKQFMYNNSKRKACESRYGANCSLLGEYQPQDEISQMFAVSGAYYSFDAVNLAKQPVTLSDFNQAAEKLCRATWDEVNQDYTHIFEPFRGISCFNAVWVDAFLNGVGVDDATIVAVSKIDGTKFSWTYGAALYLLQGK